MADTIVDSLILDLLEWLATADRSYEEVMDTWRTSCPKLPVWKMRMIAVSSVGRMSMGVAGSGLRRLAALSSRSDTNDAPE